MRSIKLIASILMVSSFAHAHEIVGYDGEPGLRPSGMPPVLTENHDAHLCFDIRGTFKVTAKDAMGEPWPDRIPNQNFGTTLVSGDLAYIWLTPMFGMYTGGSITVPANGTFINKSEATAWVNYTVICDRDGVNIMSMIDSSRFIKRLRIFPTSNSRVLGFQLANDHEWGMYGTLEKQ